MATNIKRIRDIGGLNYEFRRVLERIIWGYGNGAPTDAVDGKGSADVGAQFVDRTNGAIYKNTGTLASPTWNQVGKIGSAELDAGVLSADATGRALVATDFFNAATVDAKFATGSIGEDILTAAELTARVVAVLADDATTPGIVLVHEVAGTGGADGEVDLTLDYKEEVIDFQVTLKGAGTIGAAVVLDDGTDPIVSSIDISSGGDKDIFRAAEIDDAKSVVDAAGTLGVTWSSTGGDCPAFDARIFVIRRT